MYEKYINQLHIEAKLRNLAESSIKTYTDFILRFLEYTGKDKPVVLVNCCVS